MPDPTFEIFNCKSVAGPVVLSVPHAGRDYRTIAGRLRYPIDRLRALEDRLADTLVSGAIAQGVPAIVATAPRLVIDLNRDVRDLDPAMVRGSKPGGTPLSAKARGGLGLIPRALHPLGSLWSVAIDSSDVTERIDRVHSPYHAAIATMLDRAQATFGFAVLLDIHSMPPLQHAGGSDIVLGDALGTSASAGIVGTVRKDCERARLRVCVNDPYPGGYIVRRHGNPCANRHAIQIEFDRRLYLDGDLLQIGAGVERMRNLVCRICEALHPAAVHIAAE